MSGGPSKHPSGLRRALPLLGLGLLVWILTRLDRAALAAAVRQVEPEWLALSALPFACNLLIKGLRWWRLLAAQGRPLPLSMAMTAFLAGQFYGQITIGRLGEFYRASALTERGVPAGEAFSSCIVDRLFDLAAVLLLGVVLGAFILGQQDAARAAALALACGVAAVVLGVAAFRLGVDRPGRARIHDRLVLWLETHPWLARVWTFLRDVARGSAALLRVATLIEATAWTVMAWVGYFATLWLLASGLHLSPSRTLLTGAAALAALSALLPVTVSGLGARELIYQQVLGGSGVTPEEAVVLALAHLAVMTVAAIGLGALGLGLRPRAPRPTGQS